MEKNNITLIEKELKTKKMVALVAPSFVASFDYPDIIHKLKALGFDKVVELTFGAKMVNREYHKILEKSRGLVIGSACPGVVETIKSKYPKYAKNIIKVYSPMVATGKICRKIYPGQKTCFISPCEFKKMECESSEYIDFVIDYEQLLKLFVKYKVKSNGNHIHFDKFYNDYTKIYPLSGGLSKTAHLKGVLKPGEEKIIDGISEIMKFLEKPDPKIKFLDATFCSGGCIGGPHTPKIPISQKKKRLMHYIEIAKVEDIPKGREGLIKKAEGIKFTY